MLRPDDRWRLPGAASLALFALITACKRPAEPAPLETSAASASVASAPPPVPPPSSDASGAPSPAPCRVMRVTGTVRRPDGVAVATQDALDGRSWLDIEPRAELVLRHGASARELSLHGPGRFLPCRSGLEQVLVARGTLRSSQGTGVRPGAELWVATPFGALRYADANLEVEVERSSMRLTVRGGHAFTEAAERLRGVRDGRVRGPDGRAGAHGRPDAAALVRACEQAATTARESAEKLLGAKAGQLGELAAAQLRTRRLARARCLVAEAGSETQEDPVTRARLGDQLEQAEALWQGIPTQPAQRSQPGP